MSRIKLLKELIQGYNEEIKHMLDTEEHVTAREYFQSLKVRLKEAQMDLWRERTLAGI